MAVPVPSHLLLSCIYLKSSPKYNLIHSRFIVKINNVLATSNKKQTNITF